MPTRHFGHRGARGETLGHDLDFLVIRPAPATRAIGDHLDATDGVRLRAVSMAVHMVQSILVRIVPCPLRQSAATWGQTATYSPATAANKIWAMDWMADQLFDGRNIWVLTIVDTWSRICPAMRLVRKATAMEALAALDEVVARFGAPKQFRVDQGCQFTSRELDLWTYAKGVVLNFHVRESQPTTLISSHLTPACGQNASISIGFWIWTTPGKGRTLARRVQRRETP